MAVPLATILARAQRAYRPSCNFFSHRIAYVRRDLHQSPIALKAKSKGTIEDDDLFGSDDAGESLFSDDMFAEGTSQLKEQSTTSQASTSSADAGAARKEARLKRFSDAYQFASERIGRNALQRPPYARHTMWRNLFMLASTKEQLEQVVELFPKWRDAGKHFSPEDAEALVRRCEELDCPKLALQVFGDHPKYGMDLSSAKAARHLLHSLHQSHPLEDTMLLVALWNIYKLPPISSDLISCAMLTSTCFKHGSQESLLIANEMLPHLQKLLAETAPTSVQYPERRVAQPEKEKAWLTWTLTKIQKALSKQGAEHEWLTRWRQDSGHAAAAE